MAKITDGNMSDSEIEENRKIKDDVRVRSRLNCFKATNGLRPGVFSTIVGQQGNGKSALCKTIAMECAVASVKCYMLLSEEPVAAYKATITNALVKACAKGGQEKFLSRILFDSMVDWAPEEKKIDFLFARLEDIINEHLPEVIIFDNFTTSFLGGLSINIQGDVIDKFRRMAATYDIVIIGVFHTIKGLDIYKKVLTGEDVRGNSSSTNGSGYNYVLATYFNAEKPVAILGIDKARYHPEANKTYWELIYDKELQLYVGDFNVKYSYVNNILSQIRDKKDDKKTRERN